jgi:hypothetical protein
MRLTTHDLSILRLAARDAQGRLSYCLAEDGSTALLGEDGARPLGARDSLPRLEAWGLVSRKASRTYVLTPDGWDVLMVAGIGG